MRQAGTTVLEGAGFLVHFIIADLTLCHGNIHRSRILQLPWTCHPAFVRICLFYFISPLSLQLIFLIVSSGRHWRPC